MSHARALALLVLYAVASPAYADGLGGTFVAQGAQGRTVANLEVRGERLVGIIEFPNQARVNLIGAIRGSSARGSATSKDGSGEFDARLEGDTLHITLSQKNGPNQKAMSIAFVFQREGAGPATTGPSDRRMVGHWSYQNLIVSGNASFASEEHLLFRVDGSYAYGKSATVAGGADWSFDGGRGSDVEHGLWRAENGVLFVGDGSRWTRVGTFGFADDGSTMRIAYDGGGRKIWSRRKP